MDWGNASAAQRAQVYDVLEREAERLERKATEMQEAADRLGRPSLVDDQELKANVFRAALSALRSAEG